MLAIRMQRTGRKGHAMFRMVVQDARRTPTSGKVVASVGSYDPHAKTVALNKDKIAFYLEHGAQPSERAARLLQAEGLKLPAWVSLGGAKQGKLRNPDKLRKNRPVEVAPEAEAVAPIAGAVEAPATETPVAEPATAEATTVEAATAENLTDSPEA